MFRLMIEVRLTKSPAKFAGFLSFLFIHLRIWCEKPLLVTTAVKEVLELKSMQEVKVAMTDPLIRMDETKRKSLQPSNNRALPKGFSEISTVVADPSKSKPKKAPPPPPTAPLTHSFVHDFFGTRFMIGEHTLVSNLARRKHRLEIIGNQAYVDQALIPVNEGDIERIKAVIRKAKE